MQRVYLDRLAALVNPPAPPAGGGGMGNEGPPSPLLLSPNVPRSDLPALARAQLRSVRATAAANATSGSGVQRAHWADVVARIDEILDPSR